MGAAQGGFAGPPRQAPSQRSRPMRRRAGLPHGLGEDTVQVVPNHAAKRQSVPTKKSTICAGTALLSPESALGIDVYRLRCGGEPGGRRPRVARLAGCAVQQPAGLAGAARCRGDAAVQGRMRCWGIGGSAHVVGVRASALRQSVCECMSVSHRVRFSKIVRSATKGGACSREHRTRGCVVTPC